MASQQMKDRPALLPVSSKYSQLHPDGFRDHIEATQQAQKAILDTVAETVEQQLISVELGGTVAAGVTGSLFGWTEYGREFRPADLAAVIVGQQGNGQQ